MSNKSVPAFIYKPADAKRERPATLQIMVAGKGLVPIHESAPVFSQLLDALKAGDADLVELLLNGNQKIADFSEGRVSIYGDQLFFNGQLLSSGVAERIKMMLADGFHVTPWINFLEKCAKNPIPESVLDLYRFLDVCELPICEDGDFLAYKMVNADYRDIHSNTMDNSVGAYPKMDRKDVDANNRNECSRGLHFCSRKYLESGFGSSGCGHHLMVVKINPANVVAVPADYNGSKGRACEYLIVEELDWHREIPKSVTRNENAPVKADPNAVEDEDTANAIDNSGENNPSAKLSEDDVREIRRFLKEGFSLTVLASRYGVSRRTIARIRDGEAWTHVV